MTATIGSLFSGIGGLEMGLEMCGLGPVLWQCDSDPCARVVLEAHWPSVKRYADVRDIDEQAPRPDVICGGFPCQPVSVAGKRKAQRDTRWLWPFFAAAIARVRPRFVFIENVPGLRGAGLRDVLADLASIGFDAEWDTFSAAEVGAPHRRNRLYILAHAYGAKLRHESRRGGRALGAGAPKSSGHGAEGSLAHADGPARNDRRKEPGVRSDAEARDGRRLHESGGCRSGGGGEDVADANGLAKFEPRALPPPPVDNGRPGPWPSTCGGGEPMADANGEGELQQGGVERSQRRRPSNGGSVVGHPDRSPAHPYTEAGPSWRAARESGGWTAEPDVGRVAHGVPARMDRLRLLGNACVPAQAALAWRSLIARAQVAA